MTYKFIYICRYIYTHSIYICYICIYICIYVYIHICVYIYIYIYMYTYTYLYMFVNMCACACSLCVCKYLYSHTQNSYIYIYMYTYTRTYPYSCVHIHIPVRMHQGNNMHIHSNSTHTHMNFRILLSRERHCSLSPYWWFQPTERAKLCQPESQPTLCRYHQRRCSSPLHRIRRRHVFVKEWTVVARWNLYKGVHRIWTCSEKVHFVQQTIIMVCGTKCTFSTCFSEVSPMAWSYIHREVKQMLPRSINWVSISSGVHACWWCWLHKVARHIPRQRAKKIRTFLCLASVSISDVQYTWRHWAYTRRHWKSAPLAWIRVVFRKDHD